MEIQNYFRYQNKIYKITKDLDLGNDNLTIYQGCTLDFQGGSIVGGTVTLNDTKVLPNGCVISDYIKSEIRGTYAKGQCLFNEELGKPVWWNGSVWVDATGATV